jgi:hypothetical protein
VLSHLLLTARSATTCLCSIWHQTGTVIATHCVLLIKPSKGCFQRMVSLLCTGERRVLNRSMPSLDLLHLFPFASFPSFRLHYPASRLFHILVCMNITPVFLLPCKTITCVWRTARRACINHSRQVTDMVHFFSCTPSRRRRALDTELDLPLHKLFRHLVERPPLIPQLLDQVTSIDRRELSLCMSMGSIDDLTDDSRSR